VIPRKNYGAPLRLYLSPAGRLVALPPRSWRAQRRYAVRQRNAYPGTGFVWQALHVAPDGATGSHPATAGPHLGARVTWGELSPEQRASLRASFLSEYCPD
jgi:hypothetical protein